MIKTMPVPKEKIGQFDEILKDCGGRYLGNPSDYIDVYWVTIDPGDDLRFSSRWRRTTTPIVETVRKTSILKKVSGLLMKAIKGVQP